MLILMQMGCRSAYRFHCTSSPTPVGVTIAEEMVGMTACDVQVPKDSPWIKDGDSQEKKNVAKDLGVGAIGVVVLLAGSGVHQLLGGHPASLNAYEVRVDFDEPPADAAGR
jgi:hypothetical protein